MQSSIIGREGSLFPTSRRNSICRRACQPFQDGLARRTDYALPQTHTLNEKPRKFVKTFSSAGDQQQTTDLQGQVSSELIESMTKSIKDALEAESVKITDAYGDGRHVSIDVVSSQFEGKNSVKRQQAVYKAIWMELQETVHAVDSMTTKTPEEVSKSNI